LKNSSQIRHNAYVRIILSDFVRLWCNMFMVSYFPLIAGSRFWCAACNSVNRTCSTSTLFQDDIWRKIPLNFCMRQSPYWAIKSVKILPKLSFNSIARSNRVQSLPEKLEENNTTHSVTITETEISYEDKTLVIKWCFNVNTINANCPP